jgi:hypothetical protein
MLIEQCVQQTMLIEIKKGQQCADLIKQYFYFILKI